MYTRWFLSDQKAVPTPIKEVERAESAKCRESDEERVPVNRSLGVQRSGDDIQISSTGRMRHQSNKKRSCTP